jgi:DEAD/DEAH box helicase domain-containing protein
MHQEVLAALARLGIERLYSHQAEAVHSAWEAPTIVTTGTASGKSMCFNLPTLDVLCRDPRARALYLYPTKALAQDQARALASFGLTKQVRPAIYDGDTPREARADIRRRANIVLTNPDMLHVGILPNHPAWAELFANLAIVVVDEAHVYRGVFGSHVANVLRRLRRIAAAYGTTPRFLLTSATIANPVELAERLTGLEDVSLIDQDGSPAPGRQIAIWNPPLRNAALGARRSALAEAAELLARLVRDGARLICFMKSRKGVEVLHKLVVADLESADPQGTGPELAKLVAPYRAGYTPQQRRELEGRLVRGELRAVITTDALELGIDIGELDAAVVVTFPGTVASLRPARPGAGGIRRRRGRARPVLLPPPRRLPGTARRGSDPGPRELPDLPGAPAVRGPRGPSVARRCRVPRPALGGPRRGHAQLRRTAPPGGRDQGGRDQIDRAGEHHLRPAPAGRVPRRRGLAALGLA